MKTALSPIIHLALWTTKLQLPDKHRKWLGRNVRGYITQANSSRNLAL